MLYEKNDLSEIEKTLRTRIIATVIPTCLLVAASVMVFVLEKGRRSIDLWWLSALLAIAGGCGFVFGYGVFIKPARVYREHVNYMLNGDQRFIEGTLKSVSSDVSLREGLSCRAVLLNIGNINEEEDDRLYYIDVYKELPKDLIGKQVKLLSNNKMISSIEAV